MEGGRGRRGTSEAKQLIRNGWVNSWNSEGRSEERREERKKDKSISTPLFWPLPGFRESANPKIEHTTYGEIVPGDTESSSRVVCYCCCFSLPVISRKLPMTGCSKWHGPIIRAIERKEERRRGRGVPGTIGLGSLSIITLYATQWSIT